MANLIGPITLRRVMRASRNRKSITVYGDMAAQIGVDAFEELFALSPEGSAIHNIPGGRQIGEDLTDDLRNTWFCLFDSSAIPDGFYLLRTFTRAEDGPVFFEFNIALFLIGTAALFQDGYDLEDIGELDNDWDI